MEVMEETDQNQLLDENNPVQQENNNNADEIPIKEEQNLPNQNSGSITENKTKPDAPDIQNERLKKLRQYIVLCIYSGIMLLAFFIEHFGFGESTSSIFNGDKKLYKYFLYVISIVGALGISSLVGFMECLIKTHLFAILLLIALIIFDGFFIFFTYHKIFSYESGYYCILSSLVILVCGAAGMICAILMVRNEVASVIYLLIFNAIFMLISGVIIIALSGDYKNWTTFITALVFAIAEFNVYSSQYKYVTIDNDKKEKQLKETLMYAQPFELNLSILKVFIFIYSLIKKSILCCISCCSKSQKESNAKSSK